MKTCKLAALCAAFLISPVFAQSAAGAAAGNGPFVVPTSAAYADLTNAADQMVVDLKQTFPGAKTALLYDQATFSAISYYQSALDQVGQIFQGICDAEKQPSSSARPRLLGPIDVGTAASGLAGLIALTLPSYAIQGQPVTIDNTALIGAFAVEASRAGLGFVNPVYLMPAVIKNSALNCGQTSVSLAELWSATAREANKARLLPGADKSPLKDALDAYSTVRGVLLAADKGAPLLGKLLVVETMGKLITDPGSVAVIDMRLDGVGIDSTTRTVLWWRTTKFSSNVLAHYSLLSVKGTGADFSLELRKPGYVNVMTKDMKQNQFASCSGPAGQINGRNVVLGGNCAAH